MAENLVLQILGLATFTIFCSWLSRILSLAFHKNSNFGQIFFDFGGCFGLGYFRFGILEQNHFISILVI